MDFPDSGKSPIDGRYRQTELNKINRLASQVGLGDIANDLLTRLNDPTAKYAALLAHLDAADVPALGTGNAATFAVTEPVQLTGLPDRR
jgi:hypothetical protein